MLLYSLSPEIREREFFSDWPIPIPDGFTHPLPATGPPFDPWVIPSDASEMYRSVPAPPDDPDF